MNRTVLTALLFLATGGTALAEGVPASVAAGFNHTCARRSNGTLWCWGSNDSGQLGLASLEDKLVPTQIVAFGGTVSQVAAGDLFTCAVRNDTTLWCWGNNVAGQLGDGSTDDALVPIRVTALGAGVVQVSAGDLFACARKSNGSLWCWGSGFLGAGGSDGSLVPVQVTSLGSVVAQVSTGDAAACARKTDGTLWCWGGNQFGAVGDGTTTDRTLPMQITALGATVADVSLGDLFGCARKSDGTAWCWGTNDKGELGDGTTTTHLAPVQVTALGTSVAEISASGRHACARKSDGTLWCWGGNIAGELGDGTLIDRPTPVQVSALGTALAEVSAGMNHDTCARTVEGRVWCWGVNGQGQLGDGTVTLRRTPVQALGPDAPTAVPATRWWSLLVLMALLAFTVRSSPSRHTKEV
jgi:alpha-tubulin suppressor-like RCC1 family protein